MNPLICIHGHFYQPPRESPWLEAIEIQDRRSLTTTGTSGLPINATRQTPCREYGTPGDE